MRNKRNINSVCLSRKDLLSDKVSTKGPPDFENLTARPFTPPTISPPPSSSDAHRCVCTHTVCALIPNTRTHAYTQKKNYSNPISIKCISSV